MYKHVLIHSSPKNLFPLFIWLYDYTKAFQSFINNAKKGEQESWLQVNRDEIKSKLERTHKNIRRRE